MINDNNINNINTKFNIILEKCKTWDTKKHQPNYYKIGLKNKGKFYIPPDLENEFLILYGQLYLKKTYHFVQANCEHKCILLDIDLRNKILKIEKNYRIISDKMIQIVCNSYIKVFNRIYGKNYWNDFTYPYFVVMKRPCLGICKQGNIDSYIKSERYSEVKDGFHIMVPEIIVNRNEALYIQNEVRKLSIEDINSPLYKYRYDTEVFDESIIKSSGWMLYGSSKFNDEPYKISYYIHLNTGKRINYIIDKRLSLDKMPSWLNIHGNYNSIPKIINNKVITEIKEKKVKEIELTKNMLNVINNNDNNVKITSSSLKNKKSEIIIEILNSLTPKYYNEYIYWYKIGHILSDIYNQNKVGYKIFIDFSKKSREKFTGEKSTFEIYYQQRKPGYTQGTLFMYLKECNFDKFIEIQNKDIKWSNIIYGKESYTEDYIVLLFEKFLGCGTHISVLANSNINSFNGFDVYKYHEHRYQIMDHKLLNLVKKMRTNFKKIFTDSLDIIDKKIKKRLEKESIIEGDNDIDTIGNIFDSEKYKKTMDLKKKSIKIVIQNISKSKYRTTLLQNFCSCIDGNQYINTRYGIKHFLDCDKFKHILCFTNGVYDFKKNIFREGVSTDYITMCTHCPYLQKATLEDSEMIEITKYFESLFTQEKKRIYIYRLFASSLIGNTISSRFHIFHGVGGTGKTVLIETLVRALGDYATTFNSNIFTRPAPEPNSPSPWLGDLKSRRIIACSETNKQDIFNLQVLKFLTGLQDISYRYCHGNVICKLSPIWHVFMDTNFLPALLQVDSSIERRIVVISCDTKFIDKNKYTITTDMIKLYGGKDKIKYMNHTLKQRLFNLVDSGYFTTWLILIYNKYCKNIYDVFCEDIPIPKCIITYTQKYLDENNHIKQFFQQNIIKISNTDNKIKLNIKLIFSKYNLWIVQNNIKNVAPNKERDVITYIIGDFNLKNAYKNGFLYGYDFTINKSYYDIDEEDIY